MFLLLRLCKKCENQPHILYLTDSEWELKSRFMLFIHILGSVLRWLFCHWESIKYFCDTSKSEDWASNWVVILPDDYAVHLSSSLTELFFVLVDIKYYTLSISGNKSVTFEHTLLLSLWYPQKWVLQEREAGSWFSIPFMNTLVWKPSKF